MNEMPTVFVSHGMPTIVETPVPTRRFLQFLYAVLAMAAYVWD